MTTTHSTTIDWPSIRLLLRDYLQRRWQRILVMAAVYLFGALACIFDNQPRQIMGGLNPLMFIFLFTVGTDLPNPRRNAHHPDAKVLRSLPMTEESAAWATWLQYVGIPLFLCVASGLLAFLAGVFAFASVPSVTGRFVVYVSLIALFQLLPVGINSPAMGLSKSVTNLKMKPWATLASVLAGSLGVVALMLGAILWVMWETDTARLVCVAASAAFLLLCSSVRFRRHLVADPRTMRGAALAHPSASKQASFAPRRWQDRCHPLLAAAKVGCVLAVAAGAVTLGLSLQSERGHADDGPGFLLVLLVIISVMGGTAVVLQWMSTVRACRALPISRGRLAFGAMSLQLLTVVPSLVLLCVGAWWFSTQQQAGASAQTMLWMGLAVESLMLFVYPYAVRGGGEQYQNYMMRVAAFLGCAGMLFTMFGRSFDMPFLPGLGLALLAAALVFCYLRLRAFIANDSRMYQKHASPLL